VFANIVPSNLRIPDGQRVYAIGDVHGRMDLLEQLIARIRSDNAERPRASVRVILLGDIVDRGPEAAALVHRCMAWTARSDRFVVLKGNHEAMMVHALRGNFTALALWLGQGGAATLTSWGVPDDVLRDGPSIELMDEANRRIPAAVLNWLDALPLTLRVGGYLFVHAGIRPGIALADQTAEDMLWIRREFLESDASHPLVVVHGHSESDDGIVERPNRIGIDTAAYRTHRLSALALEADTRWTLATGSSPD
jgi:serine/threonine protein phosphatase 1